MRKIVVTILMALAVLCAQTVLTAVADPIIPPLTGRVVDGAGLLSAERRTALESELADLEQKTTVQLVVATVDSLQGYEIEDFSIKLAEAWKIGQADKDNGVILLVAPNERKVRIEVGYGLEAVLTDALSKLIIEKKIIPYFKAGNFPDGIIAGAKEIIRLTSGTTGAKLWKTESVVEDRTGKLPPRTMEALGQAFPEFASRSGFYLRAYIEDNIADPERKVIDLVMDWGAAEEPQSELSGVYDRTRVVMLFDPAAGRFAVANLGYISYDNLYNQYRSHWVTRVENDLRELTLAETVAGAASDIVMMLAGVTPMWLEPIRQEEQRRSELVASLEDVGMYFAASAGALFLFLFPFIHSVRKWKSTKTWVRVFSVIFGPPAVLAHIGLLVMAAVLLVYDSERGLLLFAVWFAAVFIGMFSVGIIAIFMMQSLGWIDLRSTGGSYSSSGYRSSSSSSYSSSSSSYSSRSSFSGGGGSFGGGGASGSW